MGHSEGGRRGSLVGRNERLGREGSGGRRGLLKTGKTVGKERRGNVLVEIEA